MPEGRRAGLRTHWDVAGQGPRAALLLHCSLARGRAWAPVAARLDDLLQMTMPDLPGHGGSDWDGADFQRRATEVAATFCDGPADLIGHSFGATVALRLAVERPETVRSLTLIEPVFFAAARGTPEHAAHEARMAPFAAALAQGCDRAAARAFIGVWGGAPWDAMSDAQRDDMTARIGMVAAQRPGIEEDSGGVLTPGRLEAVGAPVLLIRGSRTQPVMAAIHARLAHRLPDTREVVVDGAGHMVPISHPDAVAGAIRAFLSP
ncbi:hydrolase, alpha/beta fold family protein [Oceaniovalibus guishaninsula JLT2003]|uniref:Hydrolase, alpha/beta fold family protein n=1 Tax=Oceaniovalibus guishaninsula JLT2003 TaxID=1231392 RepID=K2H9E7_9RHOB|nr:alpha/beta hydrolase [Oceaniovalibus guishaninsula]EKE44153.1 hydrolase, alpha/beta fold family protein [Oceaniovalibus guishaninsula JLT2003]